MGVTTKDRLGYFLFQATIVIVYIAFLLATPLYNILDNKKIEAVYPPQYFDKILASLRSDAERELLRSYFEHNEIENNYTAKAGLSIFDKLKINIILQKNNKSFKIRIGIYFIALLALYFARYFIALFYKDKEINPDFLPTVAVIIPVKNEEKVIFQTISNCFNNGYPLNLLDVIVIDDGSTDNTLKEIKRAKRKFPTLKYKSLPTNMGKRIAIANAVKMTDHQFFVMLDSDTLLNEGAIQQVLQHFQDPKVAAVSGHTKVANLNQNYLTKAQGFKYYCSYRLFKAFEGVFGTVVCAPGCFSAYRATKFLSIMDKWHSKTFFGRRCVAGEDRALTTLLLKENKIRYSDKAIAYTYVPTTIKSFAIQQKRWMRSWFRESLYVSLFMWRKNPLPALSFYIMFFISIFAPVTLFRECLLMPLLLMKAPYIYLSMLLFIIISQAFFCVLTKKSDFFLYGFIFSLLYFFFLVWLIPVSIFTITSGNWGSRGAIIPSNSN